MQCIRFVMQQRVVKVDDGGISHNASDLKLIKTFIQSNGSQKEIGFLGKTRMNRFYAVDVFLTFICRRLKTEVCFT